MVFSILQERLVDEEDAAAAGGVADAAEHAKLVVRRQMVQGQSAPDRVGMLASPGDGRNEIAVVEIDVIRLIGQIARGKIEGGLGQIDTLIVADTGAGERRLGQGGVAAGDIEESERLGEVLGERALQYPADRAMAQVIVVDELLIDRPLCLEDADGLGVDDIILGAELMDVDIDHVGGLIECGSCLIAVFLACRHRAEVKAGTGASLGGGDMGTGFSGAPAPMEGEGAYNRNSRVQQAGASPAIPLWEKTAAHVVLPPEPEAVVIADYGSSEGHSSFGPMRAAIGAIRERTGSQRPISIVHNDLPGSDFAALFEALAGDPDSYLRQDKAVFASAVGRSFYDQVLPPSSVTLGWSTWAVQWLSHAPAPIPDQVMIAFSEDRAVRALYHRQSAEDWRIFLTHRAKELRPGGRLVVLMPAVAPDGDNGYRPILVTMYSALQQLVREGFMSAAELYAMAIPIVGRSLAELEQPFGEGRFAGLSLDHVEVFSGPDPIWEDFERDRDAKAYGARWAAFARASVLPTLAGALEGAPGRKTEFMTRVENDMVARLAMAPEKFPIPLGLVAMSKDV